MKEIRMLVLLVAMVVVIDSCTKTETKTPVATTNGTLLAGASGQSKSWTLKSLTFSVPGSSSQTVTDMPACESDNTFKFTNNSTQSYQATEGSLTCTSTDPATIESGSWAFTDDGKTLLIDGIPNITNDELNSTDHAYLYFLTLSIHGPLSVSQISDTSITLSYTFTISSTTYTAILVLQKV